MSEVAIKVENLGKKFLIGQRREGDFRNSFVQKIRSFMTSDRKREEEFWALQNVSFEIKAGEAVGIIGRNGAGKSTLLKILSRITPPTTGRFEINGRVSSLLEVGTGFHPELTGRENIFLNGTILGMKRPEIKSKFDQIVDFSGVEKFIDTPVKHYSSGMKVRLAFAVAAHLEPEILIIDEVLAVGDADFQKKCLGKMDEVTKNAGRTVLFVSHNMSAVENLCSRAFLLVNGEVDFHGKAADAISAYLRTNFVGGDAGKWVKNDRDASRLVEITGVSCVVAGNQPELTLTVDVQVESNAVHQPAFLAFDIWAADSTPLFQAIPTDKPFIAYSEASQQIRTEIVLPPLVPGNYKISVWAGPHYSETYDWVKEILSFSVDMSPMPGRTHPHVKNNGYLMPFSKLI